MLPKVSSKTNQKAEMPEVKDPFISTVSHHSKRKIPYTCCKRSSRKKHSLPGEGWVDLNKPTKIKKTFFFQPQITKWHISKKTFYTRALHGPKKTRNTWLFTCNYKLYIWKKTLFDFWVSGPTLSLRKLRKKVVSLQKLSCSLNILGGKLRRQ